MRGPAEQNAPEDAELVRRTLAGDRTAFDGLVLRYHRDLLRLLRRITRSVEDAEDLSQEAFLRAYRALDRFDLEKPFRPWLWTIGIRLALQAIARKGRNNVSLDGPDRETDGERRGDGPWLADHRTVEQIDERLVQRDLMEALDQMDPQHRAILILRVIEERSYEEIASILHIPQGTVMSRLNRARISLRKRLSGWFPGGEEDA
jgi:RNA polymerase sigma-70 factor, ECF subfamily